MNEGCTCLDRLTTKLMVPLHLVTRIVSGGRTPLERPPGGPPRTWAMRARSVLPVLVYAVGFLIAVDAAWRLSFALSPDFSVNAPLIVHSAVIVAALLLVPPGAGGCILR